MTPTSNSATGGIGNEGFQEGPVASAIESKTARIPSDVFLWAALASMGTSLTLKCLGKRHDALFVGQWAAPFLLLGLYNKLVKLGGHDSAQPDLEEEE
jgi:hypothetical protein